MDETLDVNYYYYPPEVNVGYMAPHLEAIKKQTDITTMLDIGAAHGHFSDFFLTIFPDAKVTAIECNELDRHYLDPKPYDTRFACLGAEPCTKTFYLNPDDPVGGGSSFYRENTYAFTDPVEREKEIVTLDSLELGPFEFIKLDTQGSEVDVIKGGEETIKQARFLLIECSFLDYNHGGCLIDDVIKETQRLGFRMLDTFGPQNGGHTWNDRRVQVDVLFVKDGDPLLVL